MRPTDCSVTTPYMIIRIDGGISIPSNELAATIPSEKRRSYCSRSISGTASLENTAAEATETPVMAANTAFARTVAIPTPPRSRIINASAAAKSSRMAPDTVVSSPISTNNGMTAKT